MGYGIQEEILSWIKDFLSNKTQRVAVNGCFLKFAKVSSSITQGSVFGPVLFVIFIKEFPDVIQLMLRMYKKTLRLIKMPDHVRQVHVSLSNSDAWVDIWHMFSHH